MKQTPELTTASTEAAAIAALVADQSRPFLIDVGGVPTLLTPNGWTARGEEKDLMAPHRNRGDRRLASTESLARFCGLFPGAPTQVFTNRKGLKIEAVFNPGTEEETGWSDHRASVAFEIDPCLARWKELAGKWLTQEAFGNFLRERGVDISVPNQGVILDLVENLEAHCTSKGKWKRNAQTGAVTIQWEEEVNATTKVPDRFTLALPAFLHSETAVELECRLNFRAKDGALHWQFLMDEYEAALDAAWEQEVEAFAEHPALPAGVAARIFAAA